jgi:WD40 repeat protein
LTSCFAATASCWAEPPERLAHPNPIQTKPGETPSQQRSSGPVSRSGQRPPIQVLAFSPAGTYLLYQDTNGTATTILTASRKDLSTFHNVAYVRMLTDQRVLLKSTNQARVFVCDLANGKEVCAWTPEHLDPQLNRVGDLWLSPDGRHLAIETTNYQSSDSQTIRVAGGILIVGDALTGKRLFQTGVGGFDHLSFGPDGQRLTVSYRTRPNLAAAMPIQIHQVTTVYETLTGKILSESSVKKENFEITVGGCRPPAGVSVDGNLVAEISGGVVKIRQSATDRMPFLPLKHNASSVAFSPDGKYIATGGSHPALMLWNAKSGAELGAFGQNLPTFQALGFSPDGKFIAAGTSDGTLALWSLSKLEASFRR